MRDAGKTAVVVKDSPGFLVNRILAPYLREACLLAEEGVPMPVIDRELEAFGMPMGPFVLMDTIGLDVLADVSEHLRSRTGRRAAPSRGAAARRRRRPRQEDRPRVLPAGRRARCRTASVGFPGRAAARGFMPLPHEIVARLIGAMMREAQAALADGLVPAPEEIDIATIFGIGFPPFRGGVAAVRRHARSIGGRRRARPRAPASVPSARRRQPRPEETP